MGEHFCLRWNNHQSTVVSVVESLLNSDSLTDCTLAAEGKYLKAHKLILTACSPYFEALLCQHHDKHPIFILKDVKYYELKAMLDYMYKGEVNISQDQLDSFIKTAESLQIKGLTDQGGGGNSNSIGETDSRDVGSTPKRKPLHARPDSPPAGAAPAREGSPTIKRRRRVGSGAAATGLGHHLDEAPTPGVPPVDPSRLAAVIPKTEPPDPHHPVGPPPQPPPQQPPQPQSQLSSSSALPPVKSEVFDDTGGEEIEDLTLDDDDDEDYRGGGGDTSQPGTSFEGNSQASQDYTQWQMTGDRSTDEVFMAAQEAINSQTNSQGPTFKCGCGLKFSSAHHYRYHLKHECGRDIFCLICKKKFRVKSNLTRHLVTLHNPLKIQHPML